MKERLNAMEMQYYELCKKEEYMTRTLMES